MKGDLCHQDKFQIEREILLYLREHPNAQDTMDGIVHWWLLERKIKYQQTMVKDAISNLVRRDYILENKKADSKKHYRVNKRKQKEIEIFLKKRLSNER